MPSDLFQSRKKSPCIYTESVYNSIHGYDVSAAPREQGLEKKMSNDQNFEVVIDGTTYDVETGLKTFRVSMSGRDLDGKYKTRVLIEEFGDCNPLVALWKGWKYQTTFGAARNSMELKCIRDAVREVIEEHELFRLDQIEE